MRETLFTDGKDLLDPSGKKVLLRGVNKMSVWDESDPTGDSYFAEIRKTQANSVRIVWAITKDLTTGGPQPNQHALDALITDARKHHLIPSFYWQALTSQASPVTAMSPCPNVSSSSVEPGRIRFSFSSLASLEITNHASTNS